jgi:hypothetical protein
MSSLRSSEMPWRMGCLAGEAARDALEDREAAGLVGGFMLDFEVEGGLLVDLPVVDFGVAGFLEAFVLLVETDDPPGLLPFVAGWAFFFSAITVDLTCSGDYSTFGLSALAGYRFRARS